MLVGPLGACSSGGTPFQVMEGERVVAAGDWDDADAAVQVAASRLEMAVVSTTVKALGSGEEKLYVLRTAGDEPVTLRLTRKGAAASGPGQVIEIEAKVGRFGDADRERRLARRVRDRLADLRGKDFAPLR